MSSIRRTIKRAVIILVYLSIFSAIAAAFFFAFRPKPTCNDGKLNQGEEKVDCGGPCDPCEEMPKIENLEVIEKFAIPTTQGQYDALVKVRNPNSLFGVASFDYSFEFYDENGKIVAEKSGNSFILPAETKYILAFNTSSLEKPASLNFRIKSFKWQKFSDYEEPDIAVSQREFNFISSGAGFAQLKAKIQNRSGYDFRKITTRAVLKDLNGNPVAVNETNNNDVRVNEEREVIFIWNDSFSKDIDVQKIEIEPEVDVFNQENFMKKYGSPEQYESYDVNTKPRL